MECQLFCRIAVVCSLLKVPDSCNVYPRDGSAEVTVYVATLRHELVMILAISPCDSVLTLVCLCLLLVA